MRAPLTWPARSIGGTVVRSSLMRNTIHVVSAADLWPMFTVCQPLRLDQWRLLMKADPDRLPARPPDDGRPPGRDRRTARAPAFIARARPADGCRGRARRDRRRPPGVAGAASARRRPRRVAPLRRLRSARPCAARRGALRPVAVRAGRGLARRGASPRSRSPTARIHLARRYLAAFGPASVEDLVAYVGRGKGGIGVWRDAVAALGDEPAHHDR